MVVLLVLVVFAVLIYEVWSLVQLVRYAWGQWVEWWTSRTKGPATADSTATLVVGRDGDEARHSSSMKLEAEEMQQLPGSSSLGPSLVDLKSASAVIIASTHAPDDCDDQPSLPCAPSQRPLWPSIQRDTEAIVVHCQSQRREMMDSEAIKQPSVKEDSSSVSGLSTAGTYIKSWPSLNASANDEKQ